MNKKIKKNINHVQSLGLCLQCGACYSVCPHNAISLSEGIDRQLIINDNCTSCEKCLRVCPGLEPLNATYGDPILGPVENCYLGYSSNPEIRFKSSSGGIISSLNMYLLKSKCIDGVICIRQSSKNIYVNEAVLITNSEEIISASGSRYAPSFTCCGLKDLPLKDNGYYAIVGKPCDIQAIIRFSNLTGKFNFLKIAIFCARTPAMSATKEILASHRIDEKDVNNFHYRGNGWPGYFTAHAKNGQLLLKIRYRDIWDNILCQRKYHSKRCFFCHDHTGELADISVGDAWLKNLSKIKSDGHSIVITRSNIGEKYIKECIKNKIFILDSIEPNIIKSQGNISTTKQNIYLKRFVAQICGQQVPNEFIKYNRKNNHIKNIPGLMKFFLLKNYK